MATAILLAFAVCWLTLAWLLRRRHALPMDHPNTRSLHTTPTPRIGGLGIMAGIAVASPWLADAASLPVMLGAFALAAVSLLDDVRGLPVGVRFLAHFIAAAGCLLALGLGGWALLAGVLVVVWMTNLYNFMDGMDGFAGGMGVSGFGTLALLGLLVGRPDYALASAVVAAASAGFLLFNFPPARIFMGDVGSATLGFLAAGFALWGHREGLFPLWVAVLVFSPFVVDATVTLMWRVLAGEKAWHAHRSHYYQRLVRLGWTHRRTVLAEYSLMLACALSALLAVAVAPGAQWVLIAGWVVVYAVLALSVPRLERQAGKS